VNATACDDRGADLFLVARGAPPDGDLAAHLAACAGCRADLERLRVLAAALPAASEGLAPLPATRAAVLADAALPSRGEPLPLPRRRGGSWLRLLVPAAAAAAGIGLTAFVLSRGPSLPRVEGPAGAIEVSARWGGAALDGLDPGGLRSGAVLAARETASVRVGAPVATTAVLGAGTRLRLSGAGEGRVLDLLEGVAWFEPDPPDGRSADLALRSTLRVRAGSLEVEGRGAHFTLERRASGDAVVCVEAGVAVLRSGGAEAVVSGPCRVDVPAGARPGEAVPAEPSDAAGWFARPEVLLESRPGELIVTLRPEVPFPLRIAPFDRFGPLFTFLAERPGRPPLTVTLKPEMLLRPPPAGDADSAFLLSATRSYKISVDPGTLGLEPDRYALSAVYTAHRVGGLWRGTRSSKPVDVEVK